MGLLNLPRIPRGANAEEAANIYNMAIEELEYRLSGFLQSNNIQEVGGWLVGLLQLISKDGDVGMSTDDNGIDPVRLFAGGTNKETAPWRVTQSGKMHATGATIESSDGYPKYRIDPETGVFGVYYDEFNYIEISPSYEGTPTIYATVDGNVVYQISASTSGVVIGTGGKKLTLSTSAEGDIEIIPETGFNVIVPGWSNLLGIDGVSLASELVNLQNQIDSMGTRVTNLTVSVPNHNHGNLDNSTSGGGTFNVDG